MNSDNDVLSYSQAINDFNNYIKRINSENSDTKCYKGYLIYLNQYYEFKESLNNIRKSSINKVYSQRNIKIKPVDTTDLIERLNANYKFIIINEALHQKICALYYQNSHQINYVISPTKIILYTENGKVLQFKTNKDNKIDKLSFIKIDNNPNYIQKEDTKIIYKELINNSSIVGEKIFNKNDESKIDFYLTLATKLKKEKKSLMESFSQKFVSNSQMHNEYYLINKNYMNKLNEIFYDINQIIENNAKKNDNNLLQIIKSNINNITVMSKEKIQKQLDNNEI